ncbi:hypothetical protein MAPG_03239 [Magnaporthiopsis poae ATCC 64411]|uniref:Uncharacterized protein n=1 Tax=Magnaporthiopsis poae (strain ATCC 64411 / 73-15) TaxID=644358 RepID=A0A0C4DTH2_MAGP6|nr:hypothetical protein MAPG_03239 [Magnaporthiopsis poae ATCC 64411]
MGNCCGKPEPDNFNSQGRVLGSAPPRQATAPVPASATRPKPPKVGGPPRTLGGGGGEGASSGASSTSAAEDARRKAAEAAEARARGKPAGGKLASQLEVQKKKTRNETLKEVSDENRRRRDVDDQAKTLSHN